MRKTGKICMLILAVVLFISGCSGLNLGSRGQEKVKAPFSEGQIRTIAVTEKNRYQEVLTSQVWDVKSQDGRTFRQRLASQLTRFFTELGILGRLADQQQVELTGREQESLRQLAEEYFAQLTQEDLACMGVSEEEIYDLYGQYYRACKLVEQLTNTEDLEVSDSEAKVIQVMEIVTEDAETAQQILEEVVSEDGDFQAAAKKYSRDGLIQVSMARGSELNPVQEAAFALEEGEISSIIEMDGMYYILKCTNAYDQEATQENKKVLAQEKKSQAFREIYDQFAEGLEMEFDQEILEEVLADEETGSTTSNFFSMYRDYFGE